MKIPDEMYPDPYRNLTARDAWWLLIGTIVGVMLGTAIVAANLAAYGAPPWMCP